MAKVVVHLVQQFETRVGGCRRLDNERCAFVGILILPQRVEDIISLFDEISDKLRAETEERQLLDNLVNQLLKLWRAKSESKDGQ